MDRGWMNATGMCANKLTKHHIPQFAHLDCRDNGALALAAGEDAGPHSCDHVADERDE
jgi:hypothetical protein